MHKTIAESIVLNYVCAAVVAICQHIIMPS